MKTLLTIHRASAVVVGIFVLFHLANHLMLLSSFDLHIQTMSYLRAFYRFLPVEILLLACVSLQIFSGLRFALLRFRKSKNSWQWLQLISGLYLAYFFLNHVGATLFTRFVIDLDSNIYFASVGLHAPQTRFFFVFYYVLAVSAFFAHLSCIIRNVPLRGQTIAASRWLPMLTLIAGPIIGGIIVAAQIGAFYPVTIQSEYMAAFNAIFR